MEIGLLREGKQPADRRVVLTPAQAARAMAGHNGLRIVAQPSTHRCFPDKEYRDAGVELREDLSGCDVLLGVKEVPVTELMAGRTYFMFSHTIKEQPYNRKLLQTVLQKDIRLIDYECLTGENGARVIAFGRWAGIVGAHNGLYTWGLRTKAYTLKRAVNCLDFRELAAQYQGLDWPPVRIVTTGDGRVARGAWETLDAAGIARVEPDDFLSGNFDHAVYAPLTCEHLYARKTDGGFNLQEFFASPERYRSIFHPYASRCDLFINAIFWDPKAPAFFSLEDMRRPDFRIRAIADITCDIAPQASVPSTIRPSTIAEPIYGFDPSRQRETEPHGPDTIDVMAIDNLPNELPRDASQSFGEQFLEHVLPELMKPESAFLEKGTIAESGRLTGKFAYLAAYAAGKQGA